MKMLYAPFALCISAGAPTPNQIDMYQEKMCREPAKKSVAAVKHKKTKVKFARKEYNTADAQQNNKYLSSSRRCATCTNYPLTKKGKRIQARYSECDSHYHAKTTLKSHFNHAFKILSCMLLLSSITLRVRKRDFAAHRIHHSAISLCLHK
jgi:hypothetical protein